MSHEDDVKEALKAHPISKMVAERMVRDPEYAEYIRQFRTAMQPILNDLFTLDIRVEWLDNLRSNEKAWQAAIPVLLHWLPLVNHPSLKQVIIELLATPWVGNRATNYLIEEFKKNAPIDPEHAHDLSHVSSAAFSKYITTVKRRDPSAALAWTIGSALSRVDVKGFERQIINLCKNSNYGIARQMMVMNLHRLRHCPEAEEAALDLLADQDVRQHAIIALGKMKSKRALFQLEKLLADKNVHICKEARKAITKIMR